MNCKIVSGVWSSNFNQVKWHDRPALLDRGALEVDARVEEGVVHPRDGAAVGVAVQLLVALAALKTECDANLS